MIRISSGRQIDEMVLRIETALQNLGQREVAGREVGQLVMQELRKIDHVAYVRFASVYHDFKTADEFRQELDRLSD